MSDEASGPMPLRNVLTIISGQAVVFVAIGLAIWSLSGREPADFIGFDRDQLMLGIGIAGTLSALAAAVLIGFPKLSEKLSRDQGKNFDFLEHRLSMPTIIWISICAGFGEEALFRAGLQTLASDFMPVPLAIVITSALFAAIHLAKPLVSALIFLIGALFGWIYWQTGSLLAIAIAHTLYDVFALWYLQHELDRIGFFKKDQSKSVEPETAAPPQA